MREYYIPNDVKTKGVYLSRNMIYLISFIMSTLIIIAHISNLVPPFIEVSKEMSEMMLLSWFVLIPVYFIYWVGLFVFPIVFLVITYQIVIARVNIYRKKEDFRKLWHRKQ